MISHSELIEDFFGYWPEFADAKVVHFGWAQPGEIDLALHYIDAGRAKDAVVGLRFSGVSNVELTDLKSENVVDCLSVSPGTLVGVKLEACHGLSGTFQCAGVEVTGLRPDNSRRTASPLLNSGIRIMEIDEANESFMSALNAQTAALADQIGRLLRERPFSLAAGATKETLDAVHFEYDWESFHPVAIPLNTRTGYCGKGMSLDLPGSLIPSTVESALTEAMDNEDDDFCSELREKMTDSYVTWFKTAWRASRNIASDMRGFLSVHDTNWRTDLDTGEVFREDSGLVKFF